PGRTDRFGAGRGAGPRGADGGRARGGPRPRAVGDLPRFQAHPLKRRAPLEKVIFACVHSAGRSQMAAAFFNGLVPSDRARAVSAGTEPAERVHPEVVDAMREVG